MPTGTKRIGGSGMSDTKTVAVDAERLAKLEKYEASLKVQADKTKRVAARDRIMVGKAVEMGIEVTEAEIDSYLARKAKK